MNNKKVVFTNKQYFNHIDWDKDIEKEKTHTFSMNTLVNRLSMALQVFLVAEHSMPLEKAKEEHEKANISRMLQYFYAKYVYYHSYFYKESFKYKVDLKPNAKISPEENKKFLLTDFKKTNLPIKTITALETVFKEHVRRLIESKKEKLLSKTEYYNQVKELFTQVGLKVTKPRGIRKEQDRDTVCIRHDGIPYHISMMREKEHYRHEKRDLQLAQSKKDVSDEFIERYHTLIKKIYLEIKKLPNMRNLWVMEGGGMQHQAFFGNEKGYLGILYLGMKGERDKNTSYTLVINGKENDKVLKDLNVEGIKIKTHKSVWGNK